MRKIDRLTRREPPDTAELETAIRKLAIVSNPHAQIAVRALDESLDFQLAPFRACATVVRSQATDVLRHEDADDSRDAECRRRSQRCASTRTSREEQAGYGETLRKLGQ